jgi:hypothetical protein
MLQGIDAPISIPSLGGTTSQEWEKSLVKMPVPVIGL